MADTGAMRPEPQHSTLKDRITYGLTNPDMLVGEALPAHAGVSASDRGNVYGAVTVIPTHRITVYMNTVTYEDIDPIIASDGAPIYNTSPGTWGQLVRAGQGRRM